MAELKTQLNDADVEAFLDAVEPESKRDESKKIVALMEDVTGEPAKMWGTSIVGCGQYHYVYESGREGDWMSVGFSPRKANLTLYIMSGFSDYDDLLAKLGKYKTGKSCLYIKKLADVDEDVLRELITQSVDYIKDKYPPA